MGIKPSKKLQRDSRQNPPVKPINLPVSISFQRPARGLEGLAFLV
jgi:hypothetical protein